MMENLIDPLETFTTKYRMDVFSSLIEFDLVKKKQPLFSYSFAKEHRVVALQVEPDHTVVAMSNPLDLAVLEKVRAHLGCRVKEVAATSAGLEEALELLYQNRQDAMQSVSEPCCDTAAEREQSDGYDLLEESSDSPVINLLNTICKEAIVQGASDIHFEPQELGMSVRYRIDGVLLERHSPKRDLTSQLITRIKVMAQLDIAERRLPQDGRMKLNMAGRQIDFRVSTIPCVFGERIVLRILDKSNVIVGLSKIGMTEAILKSFSSLINLPEGIVLVTGPTGSGKTTTLYSALSHISSPEINIMTIEDPVEYKLCGMAQIGVNPKIALSFATGLRHILRQDPDVVMIGEIRDKETAEIAIQASLTGHLVLSTLHTNDAPSALTRLVDMGIEPYLLTSSVVGVLAQRLVRTICPNCKVGYTPSDEELRELSLLREDLPEGRLQSGAGCEACFGSGYKGRRGLYELMIMSEPLKRQLLDSPDATKLRSAALQGGMSSLRSMGALLAKEGVTSSKEVLRVSRSIL